MRKIHPLLLLDRYGHEMKTIPVLAGDPKFMAGRSTCEGNCYAASETTPLVSYGKRKAEPSTPVRPTHCPWKVAETDAQTTSANHRPSAVAGVYDNVSGSSAQSTVRGTPVSSSAMNTQLESAPLALPITTVLLPKGHTGERLMKLKEELLETASKTSDCQDYGDLLPSGTESAADRNYDGEKHVPMTYLKKSLSYS